MPNDILGVSAGTCIVMLKDVNARVLLVPVMDRKVCMFIAFCHGHVHERRNFFYDACFHFTDTPFPHPISLSSCSTATTTTPTPALTPSHSWHADDNPARMARMFKTLRQDSLFSR